DPSAILGALQSNGRVFLINPNGIVFGAGAQIDVAGLVASTLNLSNEDFLGNRMRFTDGAMAGSVVNQGSLTGGSVYLVGKATTNEGLITSPNGEVVLAAGNSVELVNPGTPNLRVEIVAPDNEARNLGTIAAEAGRIGIYAGLINNSGTLNASSAVAEGGRIMLKSTKSTTLEAGSLTTVSGISGGEVKIQSGDTTLVSGTIAAKGSAGTGGTVQVLGHKVGLIDAASIDASGASGGGTVLVGGDYQGKNPQVQNAFRAYVGPQATIKADAIASGDGGKVVVWADDATRFYGNISARGGVASGDGGLVEVSGKRWLDYKGLADTRAPNGNTGMLLLDPSNITINNNLVGTDGSFDGEPFYVSGASAQIQWSVIQDQLAFSNAIISTSSGAYGGEVGNITIAAASPDLASSNTLDLRANNDIVVNGSITNSGSGKIMMYAGYNDNFNTPGVVPGTGSIAVNANISTLGEIFLQAGKDVVITNASVTAGGPTAPGWPSYQHVGINAVGGNITLDNASVRAIGGNSAVNDGFWGEIDIWADNGTLSVINNSLISATGGNSTAAAYGGGYANIYISANEINVSGSQVQATGGNGDWGGSAYVALEANGTLSIVSSTVAAQGGNAATFGGDGAVYLNAGDISITDSQVMATGGTGSSASSGAVYIYASNNSGIFNSTVSAKGGIGADGGEGYVSIYADGSIDAGSSIIGAEGGEGGGVYIYAQGDVTLGAVNSSDNIYVYSAGAIIDGNTGVNITAPYAYLYGNSGVGTLLNPLETQVSYLSVYANGGEIGIINAGDLLLSGFYNSGGNVAIASTANLMVDGSEGYASGNISLGANNDLSILRDIYASGDLFLQSGGNMMIGGPNSYYPYVAGGNSLTAVAGGNLSVLPDFYGNPAELGSSGLTTITTGGNVLVDQSLIYGNPDVILNVGGVININGTVDYPGVIEAATPSTIHLTFPMLVSGGFFVNGVEGAVTDATGSGFYNQGAPAVLGSNLMVTYGGNLPILLPPAIFEEGLPIPTDTLIVAMGESIQPPAPEKDKDVFSETEDDKKKNAPVCR
ncbi:MAG: filamentous hemagglutinin N-terminal domain-containing protein, partial [Burkholderiales bacterium]|nr:filamentous hemagglutinin N-terminal domain-containing protein [Burkholderiales bacterium]